MPNEPRTAATALRRLRARLDWATNELSIQQRIVKDRQRELELLELDVVRETRQAPKSKELR